MVVISEPQVRIQPLEGSMSRTAELFRAGLERAVAGDHAGYLDYWAPAAA
jgi:hypothetical protein